MKIKQWLDLLNILKKNKLFIIGVFGFIISLLFSISKGKLPDIPSNQICLPAVSPFENTISGIGFIEASSKNIHVGSYTAGIVEKIYVKAGDEVQKNDPLLQLDSRITKVNVKIAEDEVAALTHAVRALEAGFKIAQDQYDRDKQLKKGVKSEQDIERSMLEFQKAKAELSTQKHRLEQARKKTALAHIMEEQTLIRAPVSGLILKTFVEIGEFVNEVAQTPVVLMGTHIPLHVRVQVDENDMWRFVKGAKAMAIIRGNTRLHYPLTFVRLEPFAASKAQLSGASEERVDTRIVEIIFSVDNPKENPDVQLTIGQIMDIFIEARCSA